MVQHLIQHKRFYVDVKKVKFNPKKHYDYYEDNEGKKMTYVLKKPTQLLEVQKFYPHLQLPKGDNNA